MKRHILCLGDSNTHGYCADPADCVFVDNKAENVRVAEYLGIKGVIFGNEESDSNLLRARDFAELAELMK